MRAIERSIVLVGEAPARDPNKKNLDVCLVCKAVERRPILGTIAWLRKKHPALHSFVLMTRHVNLLEEWPGAAEGGSRFPVAEARERLGKLSIYMLREHPDVILLAGSRLAGAFRLKPDYFAAQRWNTWPTYVVPHPSGANRWWNSATNRERARLFLERLGTLPAPEVA